MCWRGGKKRVKWTKRQRIDSKFGSRICESYNSRHIADAAIASAAQGVRLHSEAGDPLPGGDFTDRDATLRCYRKRGARRAKLYGVIAGPLDAWKYTSMLDR